MFKGTDKTTSVLGRFKLVNFSIGTVGKASILLAVFQLLSRLVGLLRDRILASHFGASNILDVYYVSFNIPDFVFNLLVAGAVSAAFIPVFIEYQSRKEDEWKIVSNFLNFLLLAVSAVTAVLFFLTPLVIRIAAPGFSPEKKDLAVLFTRVMLLSPVIFSVSVVVGSLLQVFRKFLVFALAPIMYNIGIIFGALVLEPKFGPLGLAEGVLVGAFLHLAIQLSSVWRVGFRWQAILNRTDGGMKKIFTLTVPRAIGLAGAQIYAIVEDALATTVGVGTVAMFNLASNLQWLPVALVGISSAVASFPTLSREALKTDKKEFVGRIERQVKQILFLTVPFSFLIFFLRQEIVRILLQAGHFSQADSVLTAQIGSFFLLGVAAQSIIPVLSRSFYAMQNTKTPVVISLFSVLVNFLLAWYFVKVAHFGGPGLSLAFSLAGTLGACLLLLFLKKSLKSFDLIGILGYLGKLVLVSLITTFLLYFLSGLGFLSASGILFDIFRAVIYSAFALLTFISLSYIFKVKFSSRSLKEEKE